MNPAVIRKLVPLIVVIVLLAALAATFGPKIYRGWLLNRTIDHMLADVQAGNTARLAGYVDQSQRQEFQDAVLANLPADYPSYIKSFKRGYASREGDRVWVIVTANGKDSLEHYQGKLLWQWDGHGWRFLPLSSYAAPFSLSGEPEWMNLRDAVTLQAEP